MISDAFPISPDVCPLPFSKLKLATASKRAWPLKFLRFRVCRRRPTERRSPRETQTRNAEQSRAPDFSFKNAERKAAGNFKGYDYSDYRRTPAGGKTRSPSASGSPPTKGLSFQISCRLSLAAEFSLKFS